MSSSTVNLVLAVCSIVMASCSLWGTIKGAVSTDRRLEKLESLERPVAAGIRHRGPFEIDIDQHTDYLAVADHREPISSWGRVKRVLFTKGE